MFDDLDGSDNTLEYTLRLRHEVGPEDSWETRAAAPDIVVSGPSFDSR